MLAAIDSQGFDRVMPVVTRWYGGTGLRLRLRLPASMFAGLAQRLRDLSRGAAFLKTIETAGE